MAFAQKVWRFLVALKDGLVLVAMLMFFGFLYALLSLRPQPGTVREGALVIDLDGYVVEEASRPDPLNMLISAETPVAQTTARDLERALRTAASDPKIKVVVIDLSRFLGAGYVHATEIGAAIDAVRAANKPVLVYANIYMDGALQIAAHASEAWIDPMGWGVVRGPGGEQMYFGALLDRLKITAHVFRVGTYKSYVEPYLRNEASPEAKASMEPVYAALWGQWKADVARARPKARIDFVSGDPLAYARASGGDLAAGAVRAGLVDKVGSHSEFGARVAQLAGADPEDDAYGTYAATPLADYLAARPASQKGAEIGLVTIAGDIVDGDAGPGQAGGDRIAEALDAALSDKDIKALVVRIDSPGGSTMASERIRRAILPYRERGTPVIVSMGNTAASGGYWVATTGQRIFAQPQTLTGSIGVFAIIPSFERALAPWGVTSDGHRTTPLSGQPDLVAGLTPEMSALFQAQVDATYERFLSLVGKARGKSRADADAIAQGRPWSGIDAKAQGLVDEFGDLDAALAYAARAGGVGNGAWHVRPIGEGTTGLAGFLESLTKMGMSPSGSSARAPRDMVGTLARLRDDALARAVAQAGALVGTQGITASCLECAAIAPAAPGQPDTIRRLPSWAALLGRLGGG